MTEDCIRRAAKSCYCREAVILDPRPITSSRTGRLIAYRIGLDSAHYFVLSHPLSRFRRSEPYWIGYEDARFCTQLGLIPAYSLNLDNFTLIRLWGGLTKKLFAPRSEPIPSEGYTYWKLLPTRGRLPEFSSINFVLRQNAELKPYGGLGRSCFEDFFTFGFWSFPEKGFTHSTIILNSSSTVRLVLKAAKSLYIPGEMYISEIDLGREKNVPVAMLTLWGLDRTGGRFRLGKIDNVALTKGVGETVDDERRKGSFFINGIVCEFRRRVRRMPTLTAVALYEISNLDLFMSVIGLMVSQKYYEKDRSSSRACTYEELLRETERIMELLFTGGSLDVTIADSVPDQFSLALRYLSPVVSVDQGQVFYMHPSVYIALLENGLIDRLKNSEDIANVLTLLDMIRESHDEELLKTKESAYLRKRGIFPEVVLSALKPAIKQICLSRLLRNPPSEGVDDEESTTNSSLKDSAPGLPKDYRPPIDIMNEKVRQFLDRIRKADKKLREALRDK